MYILHINYSNPKTHVILILNIHISITTILQTTQHKYNSLYRNIFHLQFNSICILRNFKHHCIRLNIIPLQGFILKFVYFKAKMWKGSLSLSIFFHIRHCNIYLKMASKKQQKQVVGACLIFTMLCCLISETDIH